MIKKLAPFLYCMTPVCVFAENITIPTVPGQMTVITEPLDLLTDTYIFQSGIGIKVAGSFTTAGDVYIGYNAVMPIEEGSVYAGTGIRPNYSISTRGNIAIGGTLNIASGYNLTIGGNLYNFTANIIDAYGGLNLSGRSVSLGQFVASENGSATITANSLTITGTGSVFQALDSKNVTVNLGTGAFNVANGNIENKSTGTMSLTAGAITAQCITNESGADTLNSSTMNINAQSLTLNGGDSTTVASFINKGDFVGVISGATTLAHGFDLSSMDITNSFSLTTGTLSLGDRIDEFFDNNLNSFALNVTNGAISANTIRNGFSNQNAGMSLSASTAINADGIVANGGTMNLSALFIGLDTGGLSVSNNGRVNISNVANIESSGAISVAGDLTMGNSNAAVGGMNITGGETDIDVTNNYVNVGGGILVGGSNSLGISAQAIDAGAGVISNGNSHIEMTAESLNVGGNLGGNDVAIYNPDLTEGMNITVGGNIIGGTDIIGLGGMTVGGNYLFNTTSSLVAFANSDDAGYTYWATAVFDDVGMVGTITNDAMAGAEPLISVSGSLITNIVGVDMLNGSALVEPGIGINILSDITASSAIWLLHADNGLEQLASSIAALNINFCDATGTLCTNYLPTSSDYNEAGTNLPIYLASYDTDGDGIKDSLYVVFDERFADFFKMFKLQPVVARASYYTRGEYQSAGALDDLIEYELLLHGFSYESPLTVARTLFDDTPLYRVSEELYARMYDYARYNNPNVIRAFSRVFQLREANQIANALELNTHTVFKDVSDRFIDEAIWNRNRRLNKLWFIADYGYFIDDLVDNHAHGSRFGFNFGYDWQSSKTLILGWMGHMSHTRGEDNDVIDLSYTGVSATGYVDTDVRNLNFGGGAYFMKTLNNKARWYGDAMIDLNFIDVAREQTWLDNRIEGDATSFGLVGETGLIHDWLNQYVIGNVYLRMGYNFGFDMTEKLGGVDYMNLDFDGHFILTPGYSLTAQKRFYPSAWFQLRPYAKVGVEYDLVATPDTMDYKFAVVSPWRDYDIGLDPFWLHAGAGIEFLWVNGVHVGLDYRYQYNENIQMHKFHLSGMYRF